jgi:hypothetical protein
MFHPGPPCLTLLHAAGGPPHKRLYGLTALRFQGWSAVFYPFGQSTPYDYGAHGDKDSLFEDKTCLIISRSRSYSNLYALQMASLLPSYLLKRAWPTVGKKLGLDINEKAVPF